MAQITHIRKKRIISILMIVIIASYLVSQSITSRYVSEQGNRVFALLSKELKNTLYENQTDENFEYFYGPARVPKIPEEQFPKPKFEKKYFIYDCSEGICGGLGDRQEGIVAAYLIAEMMGRRFGVKMTIPCDIGNILEENKSPWIVSEKSFNGLSVLPFTALDHAAWNLRSQIHKLDLEQHFSKDVIRFNVNQEFVQYLMKAPRFKDLKWAQGRNATEIYNIVLRRLFKLKPKYQARFDNFQKSVRLQGRQLVCAHIRLHQYRKGDYHGDKQTATYVNDIWTFLKKYNNSNNYRMFVSTNAEFVRQEAKSLFPGISVNIDGPLIHVDEQSDPGCEGFAKVLLDQMTLSTCDVLFMSDSGFGRVGAMMRGTDDNLYNSAGKASYSDNNFMPSYW